MIDLASPLDLDDPQVAAFLEGVQGNILKGHGRDHTVHLFISFGDAGASRRWAARAAAQLVTSAAAQAAQTRRFRVSRGAGEGFAGLLLTAAGYAALGLEDVRPQDPFFTRGMKRHNEGDDNRDKINDPPPSQWDPQWHGEVHAMLLLADDDRERLDDSLAEALSQLEAIGAECFVERGVKLRLDFGPPRGRLEIEHFGFQDGVSNPQMIVEDLERERRERGFDRWDPAAAPSLVLTQEPGGGHGSYFVFRKLEQDVAGFRAAVARLAGELGVAEDEAGALVVGRYADGRPLVPTQVEAEGADPNNFNFADDQPDAGQPARICPFHAHIRRSNPRGDLPRYLGMPAEFERSMRIARRGITYGARPDLERGGGEPPASGVGLLFMSFQASLRQFAIQQSGSDSADFPFAGAGIEGLTGRPEPGTQAEPQPWLVGGSAGELRRHLMLDFVTLLGGDYFFAPSLGFLRSLDPVGA